MSPKHRDVDAAAMHPTITICMNKWEYHNCSQTRYVYDNC